MNIKLIEAKQILESHDFTWVMIKGNETFTSTDNGIKPIIRPLNNDENYFVEGWVADRVIGKSAAMMLVKGRVNGIYGEIMSQHALDFLSDKGIEVAYGKLVPYIENRTHDGMCPLENSVLEINDVVEAQNALNKKIEELMRTL